MPLPCPDCGGRLKVHHTRYVQMEPDGEQRAVERVGLMDPALVTMAIRYRGCEDCAERYVAVETLVERARKRGGDQSKGEEARTRRLWDTRYKDIETFVKSIGMIHRKVRSGSDA